MEIRLSREELVALLSGHRVFGRRIVDVSQGEEPGDFFLELGEPDDQPAPAPAARRPTLDDLR